jgi:Protein of unknown function (DUF4236)
MGFYIRKGFNFGPLRLNLSRSGLGMSVGVKGARIGVGPRGSYVHVGREGLYYRQSLTHGSPAAPTALPAQPTQPVLNEIHTADAATMVDASSASITAELNRVQRRAQLFPIVLIAGASILVLAGASAPVWLALLTAFTVLAAALWARNKDVTHGTAVLNYYLDLKAQHDFETLTKAFEQLTACDAAWHIDASGRTDDWKHQAGVATIMKRSAIRPSVSSPRRVVSNLKVPMLDGGRQKLYFFPDRLLVYESGGVGTVSYDSLEVDAVQSRFVEDGRVPRDAEVVAHTWQYVNKRGGPDRRFTNNPQRDVALYSTLVLATLSGLAQAFQFSKPSAANDFASSLSNLNKRAPRVA